MRMLKLAVSKLEDIEFLHLLYLCLLRYVMRSSMGCGCWAYWGGVLFDGFGGKRFLLFVIYTRFLNFSDSRLQNKPICNVRVKVIVKVSRQLAA